MRAHLAAIGCNGQEISRAHLAAIGCNGLRPIVKCEINLQFISKAFERFLGNPLRLLFPSSNAIAGNLELTWRCPLSDFHSEQAKAPLCKSITHFHYGPQWQPVRLHHHIALITISRASLITSFQPPLV